MDALLMLDDIIDIFEKSKYVDNEAIENNMQNIDTLRLLGIATLAKEEVYMPYQNILRRVKGRNSISPALHEEVIRTLPMGGQTCIFYIDSNKSGIINDTGYLNIIFINPHVEYVLIDITYNVKTYIVNKLQLTDVIKISPNVFNIRATLNEIDDVIDSLNSFKDSM